MSRKPILVRCAILSSAQLCLRSSPLSQYTLTSAREKSCQRTGSCCRRARGPRRREVRAPARFASRIAVVSATTQARKRQKAQRRTGCLPFLILYASGSQPERHMIPPSWCGDDIAARSTIAHPVARPISSVRRTLVPEHPGVD